MNPTWIRRWIIALVFLLSASGGLTGGAAAQRPEDGPVAVAAAAGKAIPGSYIVTLKEGADPRGRGHRANQPAVRL